MAEEIIIVQGNGTLRGEVAVSGAKNSALKLMAAALLGQLGFERTEIVQVAVSRAKQAGPYHMMMGQNPVFILRGEGGAHD